MFKPNPSSPSDQIDGARTAKRESTTRNPAKLTTVGVAGGGQLAQMMASAARHLDIRTVVLDPDPDCAAAQNADELIVGDFGSADDLLGLAKRCDVVTFEIELVDAQALALLEAGGYCVAPSAKVLTTIQDKLLQKYLLADLKIATAEFCEYPGQTRLEMPYVWKARRGGYDGRGVAVIRDQDDIESAPDIPALLEDLVDIDKELAILVARDYCGNIVCYPLTEINMDSHAHVLDMVVAPADVSHDIVAECENIAQMIVNQLDYVGILAVEFFLDRNGKIIVNELSPRPHNSGHYTIEACATSQFEQHLRAITGLPLGPVGMKCAAATFNLLGEFHSVDVPRDPELHAATSGVFVHDYGKTPVRRGRKMGHVTVIDEDRTQVILRANAIKAKVSIKAAT
ncbi:MAG: 5-(carboxyamino)imidazole ribonucleotide synthase [Proteobacteria bacterium]|nr:5-(carboxyamino)imidazole ribonucleotide synthase [Pseudomonadota bacterium]